MVTKKILAVILIITWFSELSAQNLEQNVQKIPNDSSMTLLEAFWKLSSDQIKIFHTNGDYFYKAIYITDEDHKYEELLGEAIDRLFILKGEYGEGMTGEVYAIGDFYSIIQVTLSEENGSKAKVGVGKHPSNYVFSD